MWRTGRDGGLTRAIDVSLDDMCGVEVYWLGARGSGLGVGARGSGLGARGSERSRLLVKGFSSSRTPSPDGYRRLGMLRFFQSADRKCLARKTIWPTW